MKLIKSYIGLVQRKTIERIMFFGNLFIVPLLVAIIPDALLMGLTNVNLGLYIVQYRRLYLLSYSYDAKPYSDILLPL